MAGPVLIVELPSADTTRAEVAALVQACSEGLGSGRCELSSNAESAEGVAIVSLRGPGALSALIEVGSRRSKSRSWRSQEISFQPQDARVERFRTLGLAIATLYNETELETQASSPRAAEKPASGEAAAKKPAEHRPNAPEPNATLALDDARASGTNPSRRSSVVHPRGWLSAGALTAYDHELPSAFRFGGQLGLGVAPLDQPLFVNLTGSYAVGRIPKEDAIPSISLSWLTIGLGGGGYLPLAGDLELRLSLQGVLVKLEAHGSDPVLGQQESQRWLLGGQVGVDLVGWASRRFGFTLGSHVQQLTGATAIAVYERPVATIAALSVQLGASLEFRPFQR